MSFQSYTFLFLLLPVAVAGWWLLNWRGHGKLAQGFLLLVSLAFYGKARLAFLPILLGSILFNFWLGKGLQTFSRCQKGFLALGLLGYNQWDNGRAQKAAAQVLDQLETTLDEQENHLQLLVPTQEDDTAREMTVTAIDGWDYIG